MKEWLKQYEMTKPLEKHRAKVKARNPDGTSPVIRIQKLGMHRRSHQNIRRYFAYPEAQVRGAERNQLGEGQSEQHQEKGQVGGGVDLRRQGAWGRPPEKDVPVETCTVKTYFMASDKCTMEHQKRFLKVTQKVYLV